MQDKTTMTLEAATKNRFTNMFYKEAKTQNDMLNKLMDEYERLKKENSELNQENEILAEENRKLKEEKGEKEVIN